MTSSIEFERRSRWCIRHVEYLILMVDQVFFQRDIKLGRPIFLAPAFRASQTPQTLFGARIESRLVCLSTTLHLITSTRTESADWTWFTTGDFTYKRLCNLIIKHLDCFAKEKIQDSGNKENIDDTKKVRQ